MSADKWRIEYWQDALSDAMEAECVLNSISRESILKIGESLAVSAEHQSMCTAPVENPLIHQMEEQRRTHEGELNRMENRERAYRIAIAAANNVEPHDVVIRDGRVMVWKKR